MALEISKVSKNGSALNVEWNDGEKSNFNFMWLRDNCPTVHDKDSRHRMFNILEISTNIEPKTCKINNEGKLEIEWSEGHHTSHYDINWLRENCYTIKNKQKYIVFCIHTHVQHIRKFARGGEWQISIIGKAEFNMKSREIG